MEGRYYYRRMDLSILYHMKTEDAYMHYILNWQYVAIISLDYRLVGQDPLSSYLPTKITI